VITSGASGTGKTIACDAARHGSATVYDAVVTGFVICGHVWNERPETPTDAWHQAPKAGNSRGATTSQAHKSLTRTFTLRRQPCDRGWGSRES